MAKSRQKKRRGKKSAAQQQSAKALRLNGMKAFDKQDYDKAIHAWERTGEFKLRPALAEAHLRRGLLTYAENGDDTLLLADLKKASRYTPKDARILFHLGVVALRQGQMDKARTHLQAAQQYDAAFATRVAFPLLLIKLYEGETLTRSAEWRLIAPAQRALLSQAQNFSTQRSHRRPAALRGFAAYDSKIWAAAQRELKSALEGATPHQSAILYRYLGNIAAVNEAWTEARDHWHQSVEQSHHTESLSHNISELAYRMAEEAVDANTFEKARLYADEATAFGQDTPQLQALRTHIYAQIGYQQAQQDNWSEALGAKSFRLAYNLALGYEQLKQYFEAAEQWSEVLQRRPQAASHPDALSSEQVTQLWQRSAEAYIKVSAFDEALKVYRTAIAQDEDNLPLRMAYIEALMVEGEMKSAENEVKLILEQDPDHIPALMLISEIQTQYYELGEDNLTWGWERVLELNPKHEEARNALTEYYVTEIDEMPTWGEIERTQQYLEKALQYSPQHPRGLHLIGSFLLETQDAVEEADIYFTRLLDLAGDDSEPFGKIIRTWLHAEEHERAEAVFRRAKEEVSHFNVGFFALIISVCHKLEQDKIAKTWLERGIQTVDPDKPLFFLVGKMLSRLSSSKWARFYLELAIETDQRVGEAHLSIGIVDAQEGNLKAAKQRWNRAERIARHDKDKALIEEIKRTRRMFNSSFGSLFSRLSNQGAPPELLEMMMDMGSDEMPPELVEALIDRLEDNDGQW